MTGNRMKRGHAGKLVLQQKTPPNHCPRGGHSRCNSISDPTAPGNVPDKSKFQTNTEYSSNLCFNKGRHSKEVFHTSFPSSSLRSLLNKITLTILFNATICCPISPYPPKGPYSTLVFLFPHGTQTFCCRLGTPGNRLSYNFACKGVSWGSSQIKTSRERGSRTEQREVLDCH